ncbi:PDR/VanB family oxidoreductase [Mycobacterium sp. NAZ190054]|uniref:PDR/VanB family oxidoreductase n=1 Tax=Mycobacterium sp. NAZ190054 TaxID=1747766 RepID=UPI000799E6FB|nr:PDR/VanB family oxidoreductase [Mycobacterium sp. NAZ190054]KWX69074.1 ferredoxin [Mycobacterium sp. NAZ190054]
MTLKLVVTALDDSIPGIRSVTLSDPAGGELPGFVPGSHLAIEVGEKFNAYSLTGSGVAPRHYTISVLRVVDGTGSAYVHDRFGVGDTINARLPRSAFPPVARARRHLLIAGGIGVTPIVSHLRAARAWGRETQVLYTFRDGYAAHLDDIRELAPDAELISGGPGVFMVRLRQVLTQQPLGTHLYVCGPGPMIDAVVAAAGDAGWPASRVHLERFAMDAPAPGDPFTVTLTKTGTKLEVPSGTSLLEALDDAGVSVPNLCRQGVCGECRIPVESGTPLHRDMFLSDDEKRTGATMMACVSRCSGSELAVAL